MTAAAILFALAVVMFAAVLGRGTVALVARGVAVLVFVALLVAVLSGCAPPPPRVTTPAWMLTPVPTADVGVDALHAWNCVTPPEAICTEWHEPVTN